MSINIPKNIIITSKYTSGGELILKDSYIQYKGYYYELNGKIFAGKEFDINAKELIKSTSDNLDPLLLKSSTYLYGLISKSKNLISPTKLNTVVKNDNPYLDQSDEITYYAKKINLYPPSIKQIDKVTYDKIQKDPFYSSTKLNPNYSNIEQAEKELPGIKAFLGIV